MIRSGGSIINAARVYQDAGAERIYVITTHGLFINRGLYALKDCGLIERVVCTDTHPHSQRFDDEFLEVRSVASLICQRLEHRL